MGNGQNTGFTAKIKIKRKTLPSSPIHVKIAAAPGNPEQAEDDAFTGLPSSQRPKTFKAKTPRGVRAQYR